jgi:hypothetical protein
VKHEAGYARLHKQELFSWGSGIDNIDTTTIYFSAKSAAELNVRILKKLNWQ